MSSSSLCFLRGGNGSAIARAALFTMTSGFGSPQLISKYGSASVALQSSFFGIKKLQTSSYHTINGLSFSPFIRSFAAAAGEEPEGESEEAINATSEPPIKRVALYVRTPLHMDAQDLTDLFTPYGKVTRPRIMYTRNGEHRGYGFVEMFPGDAQTAIDALNGTQLEDGSEVFVAEARYSDKAKGPKKNTTAFIGNLSKQTTENQLRSVFEEYGEVLEVRLIRDTETGVSRGFAFVKLSSVDAMDAAIEGIHGMTLEGREMQCNKSRQSRQSGGDRGGGGGGGGGADTMTYESRVE